MAERSYKRKLARAYAWGLEHVMAKANIQHLLASEREYCPICTVGRLKKLYRAQNEFQMECRKCGRCYDFSPPPPPPEVTDASS